MKKDTLNKAFGGIDDDLLRSAEDITPVFTEKAARKTAFWRTAALTATALLLVTVSLLPFVARRVSNSGDPEVSADPRVKPGTLYLGSVEYSPGRVIETDLEEYLGEEIEVSAADNYAELPEGYCNAVNYVSPDVAVAGMNSCGEYVWYICNSYVPPTLLDYLSALGLNSAGFSARNYGMDVTGMLNMELGSSYSAKLVNDPGDTGPVLYVYDAAIGPVEGQIIFTRYNYVLTDFMGDKRVFLREGGVMDRMPEKGGNEESAEETSAYFAPDHQTAEFLEAFEKSGIRKWNGIDYCVNTTPEWMYEQTGAQRFSLSVADGTYIWLDGEIYDLGGLSICKLFTAMYPCDFDNDGVTDILYHFTYGSGIDGWRCGVFNTRTKTDTLLDMPFICPGTLSRLIEVTSVSDGAVRTEYCIASSAGWISGSPAYCDGYVYGTFVSDPSSPGGVSFRRCEPYQIVDLKNYWNKLKSAEKKEYFTLEELYAGCVRLFAERSLIKPGINEKGSPGENYYIYADEENIERNLLSVLECTMLFSFEKYSYLHSVPYSGRYGFASIRCYYGEAIGDIEESARSVSAVRAVPHMTVDLIKKRIYGEDNETDYTDIYAQKYPISMFIPEEPPTDHFSGDPSKRK